VSYNSPTFQRSYTLFSEWLMKSRSIIIARIKKVLSLAETYNFLLQGRLKIFAYKQYLVTWLARAEYTALLGGTEIFHCQGLLISLLPTAS
jgi:hypothetical protein